MSESTTQLDEYTQPDGVVPDKREWREVLACWRGFAMTRKHHEQVYYALVEMEVPVSARTFHQVRAHPNGRKLFRNKPDLLAILGDDDYLASLPTGSLGHAYRSFMATNHLHAGVYDEAKVIRPLAEKQNWDEDFYYFMVRSTALHDVFHTIGGYGPDVAGEIMNYGFHCGQIEPAGPLKNFGYLLSVVVPGAPLPHKLRVYRQALERGRRADKLMAAPWEELLDKPINDVREQLGVVSAKEAHPNGVWFTTVTPIGVKQPTRWVYEESSLGSGSVDRDGGTQ